MTEQNPAGPRRSRFRVLAPGTTVHARPASDLVLMLEASDPKGTVAAELSSAAMRAGDLVRGMRREARLSQGELAARIGVSQARISELEAGRGQQGPTWDVMDRVARACGLELGVVGTLTTGTPGAAGSENGMEVGEGRLRAGKREVAAGAVRVRSHVVERPAEEQVHLREERVMVERRPVERSVRAADAEAFREHTLHARATSEEPSTGKEARVVEEIGLRKEATERTETVRGAEAASEGQAPGEGTSSWTRDWA